VKTILKCSSLWKRMITNKLRFQSFKKSKAFDYPYDEDSMCMLSIFFDVAHYFEQTSAISMINDNSDDINLREDEKERKRPVRDLTRDDVVDQTRIFRMQTLVRWNVRLRNE